MTAKILYKLLNFSVAQLTWIITILYLQYIYNVTMKYKTHRYRTFDQKRTHLNSIADVRNNFRVDLFASINIESEISSRSAPAGYWGISDVIFNAIKCYLSLYWSCHSIIWSRVYWTKILSWGNHYQKETKTYIYSETSSNFMKSEYTISLYPIGWS